MPYHLGKSEACPASKPHAVLKEDGKPVPGGCHATRGEALKHHRALQANVEDAELREVSAALTRQQADR